MHEHFTLIDNELAREIADARHPAPILKQAISDFRQDQENRFRAGESATLLVREFAAFMDEVIVLAWQRFNWQETLRG